MIHSCRQTSSTVVAAILVIVSSACVRAEEPHAPARTAPPSATRATDENPFTRPSVEPTSESCVTMTLDVSGGSFPSTVTMLNKCDHSVAVLTSPLEVRIRLTGKEKFVHERMPWTAYAIFFVVASDLRDDAFRGDGVIRDGGLRVNRPPGYTTVAAKGIARVPVRCELDVPRGRYALALMTYEAPQGDAPAQSNPFNCDESVQHYNIGVESPGNIRLGGDVGQVQSGTVTLGLE